MSNARFALSNPRACSGECAPDQVASGRCGNRHRHRPAAPPPARERCRRALRRVMDSAFDRTIGCSMVSDVAQDLNTRAFRRELANCDARLCFSAFGSVTATTMMKSAVEALETNHLWLLDDPLVAIAAHRGGGQPGGIRTAGVLGFGQSEGRVHLACEQGVQPLLPLLRGNLRVASGFRCLSNPVPGCRTPVALTSLSRRSRASIRASPGRSLARPTLDPGARPIDPASSPWPCSGVIAFRSCAQSRFSVSSGMTSERTKSRSSPASAGTPARW